MRLPQSQAHSIWHSPLQLRIPNKFKHEGIGCALRIGAHLADLVQAVAGEGVSDEQLLSDPLDVRERIQLLTALREQQRLASVQAVVQRAARLAEKGDLALSCLDPATVIDPKRFESSSEAAMLAVIERLHPLAAGRDYITCCRNSTWCCCECTT